MAGKRRDWKAFCEYEKEVNDSIVDAPMLALCTYPLPGSAAAEILDVARTHQFAIARRNKGWEVVETSELKQAKAEILRLNNNLERRVMERTSQLMAANEELRHQMAERQRAEEALLTAQAELAHVTRVTAMGELVASIVHEVTQPLTGIVSEWKCMSSLAGQCPAERRKGSRRGGTDHSRQRSGERSDSRHPHSGEEDPAPSRGGGSERLDLPNLNASERRDDAANRWSYKLSWRLACQTSWVIEYSCNRCS